MASVKRLAKSLIYHGVNAVIYRLHAMMPVREGTAIFLEMTDDQMSQDYSLMNDELARRGIACEFISLRRWSSGSVSYLLRCMAMAWKVARAQLVFLRDANMPFGCLPLRQETVAVQLWHACGAFKRFGMSAVDGLFGDSREDFERFPRYGNLSLATVSSPEVVWAYEEAMCLEGKGVVRPLGVSRTDVYYDDAYVDARRDEVEAAIPEARGRKALLYAPTFRGHVDAAQAPDALDSAALSDALGDGWVILVKHHPFVKDRPEIPAACAGKVFDVSTTLSIDACLCRADACLSDYSSLVFEYSLFRRPMAFFAYDRADYDDWRGFYYDYDQMTPGPVFTTNEELCAWAKKLDEPFDPAEIDAFREKYMSACDGHATSRIADAALSLRRNPAS